MQVKALENTLECTPSPVSAPPKGLGSGSLPGTCGFVSGSHVIKSTPALLFPRYGISFTPFFFLSRSVVSDSLRPHGVYSPWNSPGQNTGVGSLPLLQGIFPTQGSLYWSSEQLTVKFSFFNQSSKQLKSLSAAQTKILNPECLLNPY